MSAHNAYDIIIVGGGIVGLSTALQLTEKYPKKRIMLIEKEQQVATHQSGHNSGVIHAGVYYKPGSLRARLSKLGCQSMMDFCQKHGIPFKKTGKIIVAVDPTELHPLENLYQRALENGLAAERLAPPQLNEREPNITAIAGFWVPSTGVVDYRLVAEKYAELFKKNGGELILGEAVETITEKSDGVTVESFKKTYSAKQLIACAGLQSDRIARLSGFDLPFQIVPFRGEYYRISLEKAGCVNGLVYPVPNPKFPFLGVHFTQTIDSHLEVGPNAVLSFAREGYHRNSFDWHDTLGTLGFSGFWRLARQYFKTGAAEMIRSHSKSLFARNVQRYLPVLTTADLSYAKAGIRAQALGRDGRLIEDFVIMASKRTIHVCNAPSPAATASLPIGATIVSRLEGM